jgi:pimeloyl-ACP methyl ester carboxylesterase
LGNGLLEPIFARPKVKKYAACGAQKRKVRIGHYLENHPPQTELPFQGFPIRGRFVQTRRHNSYCLEAGDSDKIPLILLHGNTSSSTFWVPLMLELSSHFYIIAPDLTGFGKSEFRPIQAASGVQDWSEDVIALMDEFMIHSAVVATHSMGGIIGWDLLRRYASRVCWLIQIAPGSPFGFGGTMHESGLPTWPDFGGSGAGLASDTIHRILQTPLDDLSIRQVDTLRAVLRNMILSPHINSPWEEFLLESMLQTRTGEDAWPGDVASSGNWPGYAPGAQGILNALSPKYLKHLTRGIIDVQRLIWSVDADYTQCALPHVTWIRGEQDKLVADISHSDAAGQGKLGIRKDWPGISQAPPQPMIAQIRAYLDTYRRAAGSYDEICIPGVGHSPHIEDPARVARLIFDGMTD